MSKDYLKLDRLNESHDEGAVQIPEEVLNMTVKEMLDKLEQNDSDSDDRYEMIEDAIFSCLDCLVDVGYDSDQSYSDFGSVETYPDDMVGFDQDGSTEDDSEHMPSFSDMGDLADMSNDDSLDNFNF